MEAQVLLPHLGLPKLPLSCSSALWASCRTCPADTLVPFPSPTLHPNTRCGCPHLSPLGVHHLGLRNSMPQFSYL